MAIKLIINKERKRLTEGRKQGEGFAFLDKNYSTYKEVHPKSPCKDYLNDIVFCENNKGSCNVYGLKYKYQNLFRSKKYAYLSVAYLSTNKTTEYDKKLNKDYLNQIPEILNRVALLEKELGYIPSKLMGIVENSAIIRIDKLWIKNQFRISLFGLLFRYAATSDTLKLLKQKMNVDPAIRSIKNNKDNKEYKTCEHSAGIKSLNTKVKTQEFKEKNKKI